jgi:hypothetical protein
LSNNLSTDSHDHIRERFCGLRARVVSCREHSRDERGTVYAISIAFCESQQGCFQLVSFLERQSARKIVSDEVGTERADPAKAGRRRALATAA